MSTAIEPLRFAPPLPLESTGLLERGPGGEVRAFLRPGDWLFGGGRVRVSTLLGSCVSLVLWAPSRRLGGLCHGLLPQRRARAAEGLDGRFLDEAATWLEARLVQQGIAWHEVRASVFGGAGGMGSTIGAANVAWAQDWLSHRRVAVDQMDVGGRVVRRLTVALDAGIVSVAHGGPWTALEDRP